MLNTACRSALLNLLSRFINETCMRLLAPEMWTVHGRAACDETWRAICRSCREWNNIHSTYGTFCQLMYIPVSTDNMGHRIPRRLDVVLSSLLINCTGFFCSVVHLISVLKTPGKKLCITGLKFNHKIKKTIFWKRILEPVLEVEHFKNY